MFASDRDLLVLEPYLFRDHAWVGQRLVRGAASLSGTTLDFSTVDIELDAAHVSAGCVVTVAGSSYEITGEIGTKTAAVSRLRASREAQSIGIGDTDFGDAWIVTFAPQIAMVHRQVLRMAGIEPDAPGPVDGRLGEEAITNGAALAALEALGTLHLIFAAASSVAGLTSPAAIRSQMYRDLFREEKRRVSVELDTNGDGLPDVSRRLNVSQFVRG